MGTCIQAKPSFTRSMIMEQKEVLAVKITKEIVVKFIEVGRLSVNSFEEVWKQVHRAVSKSLKDSKS
jgi:hypothetical protein